ncbi:bifunctional diaminohydroxyphosphoribosylaminopyrimidine deaminase/5-amino-6-(5-phosphoribosylamino)uracil reductase RibD [Flavobacterium agrisoli]|uniref:Riboflavin biosynthesis protein RibD n=1 Tax=Flavobacterium agrisoli TaxID=2793066 RepID=A0A934PKS7_9FLAO|nr:bifunctional diaminohydroxyphosphoribosylaminopyrimidine deaminase/5-amino-6-(5-phosphoribosylamino)uracil reductase RibD [Flavobacterium agrisoli]MBK0369986.1 bifunctional diaminohydroxyphosphoribosylaminopyrimidine deaminase/5-amino-6-(5-phosphoribosylamino)uracil reductase RibD [Flavobacterium agrisoli]
MEKNEKYIRRCLEIAKNGLGTTYPNPMVGSVIVHNNRIIGEGWHKKSGEPHAEVNAVNAVKNKSLLKEATIYVSLEPCSHFGKTPPCCDLIIANEIPNVVIGTVDPNEKVAGNGIKKLIAAGKKVTVGILEKECYELNKRFFTYHNQKRPYIILKWAETADSFLAPLTKNSERAPVWITNSYSRQLVHKWRTEEQAILVGTQTAVTDNPKLDARTWFGNNPVRVLIDQNHRIPTDSHLVDNTIKTIIFSSKNNTFSTENTFYETIDFSQNTVQQILSKLYDYQIQSVIIEGGLHTLQSFIDAYFWDEARVFIGKSSFGNGIPAPKINGIKTILKNIEGDQLYLIKKHD